MRIYYAYIAYLSNLSFNKCINRNLLAAAPLLIPIILLLRTVQKITTQTAAADRLLAFFPILKGAAIRLIDRPRSKATQRLAVRLQSP